MAKRQDYRKTAAFNLGVAEALKIKKDYRDTNFVVGNFLNISIPLINKAFN
jgi:hypothetical protein